MVSASMSIGAKLPVTDGESASLTWSVWVPTLLNVTWMFAIPFLRAAWAGILAAGSVLVSRMDPPNPVTTRLLASSAVTVTPGGAPARTTPLAADVREKCVAGGASPPPPHALSIDDATISNVVRRLGARRATHSAPSEYLRVR